MNIPNEFTFIKWLKEDTVALVENKFGKRFVVKSCPNRKILAEFSQLVLTYTKNLKTIMPKIEAGDGFLFHEYIQGQLSGDTTNTFGIIEEAFSLIAPKVVALAFYELQTLSTASLFLLPKGTVPSLNAPKKRFLLEERKSDWYLNNLKEAQEALETEFNPDFFVAVQNFLGSKGRTINNNTIYLANGDLHPANLLIKCLLSTEAKNFMFSDWDILHFNNPAYDLADLFVWGWRNKEWRQKLVNEFTALYRGNKDELAVCLSYCQVYLASQMVKHSKNMLRTNLNEEVSVNAKGLLESSKELLTILIK